MHGTCRRSCTRRRANSRSPRRRATSIRCVYAMYLGFLWWTSPLVYVGISVSSTNLSNSFRYTLAKSGLITPQTILQTAPFGPLNKRVGRHLVNHAHFIRVDLDPLHQRPNDLPPRLPTRLL